jgi:hypothetical protein
MKTSRSLEVRIGGGVVDIARGTVLVRGFT